MSSDETLRYPVGRFTNPGPLAPEQRTALIASWAAFPALFRAAVAGLTDAQLDTPYRPGGWSVRQVVHHVPESHMNSYIRLKFALLEDNFVVKPYDEGAWSTFPDQQVASIAASLSITEGVHSRMATIWRVMTPEQFTRMMHHPENGPMTLDHHLAMYEWHARHHLRHVTSLRERMGW